MRSTLIAYLLWLSCLFAICGLHRIYAGKPVTGLIWLFTFGLLGIGQIIDLFLIPSMIAQANASNRSKEVHTVVVHLDQQRGR